jgi:putative copper export protein
MNPAYLSAFTQWALVLPVAMVCGTAVFAIAITRHKVLARETVAAAFARLWHPLAILIPIAAAVALVSGAAEMAASTWLGALPLIPQVIRLTHAGFLWGCRLALAFLLAAAVWGGKLLRRRHIVDNDARIFSPNPSVIATLAAAMLLLESLQSHASDWGWPFVAVHFLHQTAAATWLGSLAGLCLLAAHRRDAPVIHLVARHTSTVAAIAVTLIAATGATLGLRALGLDYYHLFYSAYGRTLLTKAALFAAILAIGGYNRYYLVPAAEQRSIQRLLLRNVAIEVMFLIAVFWVAALLANTPPAHGNSHSAMMAMGLYGAGRNRSRLKVGRARPSAECNG